MLDNEPAPVDSRSVDEVIIGIATRMTRQANNIFIPSSCGDEAVVSQNSAIRIGRYQTLVYQSLARGAFSLDAAKHLGEQLASLARNAYMARRLDEVEELIEWMLALPLDRHSKAVAQSYRALLSKDQRDFEGARSLLGRVIEEAPPQHKARVLQAVGLTYNDEGRLDEALPFFTAAGKAARDCDPVISIQSRQMIAVVRSINGDHKRALADLEGIFPWVQVVAKHYPALYYDILNALAVELGETGRLNEARAAADIALGSPYASAYPEWSETREDLEAKRTAATSSVVAVSQLPEPSPTRPAEPSTNSTLKRRTLRIGARALRWLLLLPAFSEIPTVAVPPAVKPSDRRAANFKKTERLTIGPGPRAPPSQII